MAQMDSQVLRLVDPYQAVRAAWATHRLQKRARAWLERARQQRAKSIVARAASVAGSSSAYTDETESVASTAKEEAALLASYDKFGRGVKADTPGEHGSGADPHGIVQRLQGAGTTSASPCNPDPHPNPDPDPNPNPDPDPNPNPNPDPNSRGPRPLPSTAPFA